MLYYIIMREPKTACKYKKDFRPKLESWGKAMQFSSSCRVGGTILCEWHLAIPPARRRDWKAASTEQFFHN
jgi:hypothetical protein